MFPNQSKALLFLLVILTIGDQNVWASVKNGKQVETAEKNLPVQKHNTNQEPPYSEQQVKKAERLLNSLPENVDKIKILLKVCDWYEASYNNPKTLEKAFQYAEDALRISQAIHSNIYSGKCYLQLSMIHELRNHNSMIEVTARKAIAVLTQTNDLDDLAESWVMVWSSKMRTNAPIKERLEPIFKAAALFETTGNCFD